MKENRYRSYLLIVLLVTLAFNYQDRWALGLVLQDIKKEYSLSDAQLGLMTGIAFAALYSVMGIPLARWADRGNRVTLMTLTISLWSLMVAICGAATSFGQLLLIRMGVAIGEAGCIPAAHSLIPDYFNRTERPRAVAFFLSGIPLSLVVGNLVAGWLNELYGWRVMFMMLGLPGLGLAVLVRLTLKEPRDIQPARADITAHTRGYKLQPAPSVPRLREGCIELWANTTFRHMLFNFAINSFFNVGIQQWQATFLIRSYGLQTGEVGAWLTLIYGVGGAVGIYLGGYLATRYAGQNERLQLKTMALIYFCDVILFSFIYLSHNPYCAFGLMAATTIAGSATGAPQFALIQSLVPERMRATSIALVYLCANLIGLGLGPLVAGVLSDAFRSWAGEESLRYALLVLCPGYFWAGWHLWRGSKSVIADLAAVQADNPSLLIASVPDVEGLSESSGLRIGKQLGG